MTAEDTTSGPAARPEAAGAALSALYACHVRELRQVRDTISELLELAQAREDDRRQCDKYAALVPQLLEANQYLVLATFGAQDSQAAAEQRSRNQTEFLSLLAHELRNPLQPIALANELIGKLSSAHPDLPMLQGIIRRQVTHMARLVDELLDASRVSSGKIRIDPLPQPLYWILDSAVEASRHAFASRRQELRYLPPAETVAVNGDLGRLVQVFSNLLLNASKYTHAEGCVSLSVQAGSGAVEVTVSDNGAGIPLETQPHIFELFTQGPRPPGLSAAGLGVGLSLVRTIAELHGGAVRVFSGGVGLGSAFTVSLPLVAWPAAATAP